jgi:catechol 2,3-dioxygenase-like lactoylglutathione lyase family enzyme
MARAGETFIMARVKHIAIRTNDVEKTAAFYREAFGLMQVGAGQSGVYLSDGYLNIAVLKLRAGRKGEPLKLGVDHIGFEVDDVEATVAHIRRLGGKSLTERMEPPDANSAGPHSYFEVKCLGPDEQVIDVSSAGWIGGR